MAVAEDLDTFGGVVHDWDFQQIQGGQQLGASDSSALEERNLCLPGSPADWNCSFNLNEFHLLASLNLLEAYFPAPER